LPSVGRNAGSTPRVQDADVQRVRVSIGLLCLLVSSIVACDLATPVPAGARVVQVTITESAVVLEPDTVRAGDV
jgi:hypothetical protein